MNGKQVMFFSVAMAMLAGCGTPPLPLLTPPNQLPSGKMLSVTTDQDAPKIDAGSPGVFNEKFEKYSIIEKGDDWLQIQIGGRSINILPPENSAENDKSDKSAASDWIPIYTQPLTSVLWDEARDGKWDFRKIQLYISGTVVLEYEEHTTELQEPTKDRREKMQGIEYLKGQSSANNEMVPKSTYANTTTLLETMTPGVALRISPETGKIILDVSFENGPNGDQRFLKFEQDPDRYGYFYLQPNSNDKIPYGDKQYQIRFDEKREQKPYLMIRSEYNVSRTGNSLSGRRIQ